MSNASALRKVVLFALLIASLASAQSTYQGRTAEEWIARFEKGDPAAREALVAMGPEAVQAIQEALPKGHGRTLLEVVAAIGPHAAACAPAVARFLNDTDKGVRIAATTALGRIGAKNEKAVDALAAAVSDPAGAVRKEAVIALGRIGPPAASAVPALIKALDDYGYAEYFDMSEFYPVADEAALSLARIAPRSNEVQRELALRVGFPGMASQALVEIGPDALPLLMDILVQRDPYFATDAIGAVKEFGREATPGLAKVITNPAAKCRREALEALVSLDAEPEIATMAFSACLKDPDLALRQEALGFLGKLDLDPSILPLLVACLNDRHLNSGALEGIARLGDQAQSAVPAIIPLLSHGDEYVRSAAATALGEIGPEARSALPTLAGLLSDPKCAREAAVALRKIGPEGKEVAEALAGALRSEEHGVAEEAAAALARMGPEGARRLAEAIGVQLGIPGILAGMGEDAAGVALVFARRMDDDPLGSPVDARRALLRIGPAAVPTLVDALRSEDPRDRAAAARGIRELALDLPEAQAALRHMSSVDDPAVRAQGAHAFAWADLSDPGAQAALEGALHDASNDVANIAWIAAIRNPSSTELILDLLVQTIDHADAKDRSAIVWLIDRAVADPRARVQALRRAVDVDPSVRAGAVDSLAQLARTFPEAVPEVVSLLGHRDDLVRRCAVLGIAEIGPPARESAEALLSRLQSVKGIEAAECLRALAGIGADAAAIGPHLITLWGDKELRRAVGDAFVSLGDGGIPWLERQCDQADEEGRAGIPGLLHDLLPSSPRAVDLALHILREHSFLTQDVARALQPGPVTPAVWRGHRPERNAEAVERARRNVAASQEVVRWLAEHLESRTTDLGVDAAETLAQLSPDIGVALPELAHALGGDASVAMRAMRALQRAGIDGAWAAGGMLSGSSPQARGVALDLIAEMGASAAQLAPQVLPLLEHDDAKVRRQALLTCARIGARDPSLTPRLATVLASTDADLVLAAASILRGMGPAAEETVPALASRLSDRDGRIRLAVFEALAAVTPDDPAMRAAAFAAMCDMDVDVREAALRVVSSSTPIADEVIASLLRSLGDREVRRRAGAAKALGSLGTSAAEAVVPLAEALRHGPQPVRVEAARALGAIGVRSQEVFSALVDALGDGDVNVRAEATMVLRPVTGPRQPVPHALVDLLRDEHEIVRALSSHAILRFGPLSDEDAPFVRALLGSRLHESGLGVEAAATCLARSGRLDDLVTRCVLRGLLGGSVSMDDDAVAALVQDGRRTARLLAEVMMWIEGRSDDRGFELFRRLGEEASAAAPPLIRALENGNGAPNPIADRILASVVPAARAARRALWEQAHRGDENTRGFVVLALARSGEAPERLIPLLERGVRYEAWPRVEAIRALGDFGSAAKRALPTLWNVLKPRPSQISDPHLLVAAAEAIRRIDPDGEDPWPAALKPIRERVRDSRTIEYAEQWGASLSPAVGRLLEDEAADVRLGAARMLGAMGRRALAALDGLKSAANDPDPEVREAARAAIQAMGGAK